jgi:SEC-C motif-containing protein
MKDISPLAPCPCGRVRAGRPLNFEDCCGCWLETDQPAPDAESLMRSRYCAFVLERAPYLLATWNAAQRPVQLEFEPDVRWLGLEVRRVLESGSDHAEVEFIARQKPRHGPAVRLHEHSRFVRMAGRWYYVDGNIQ